MARLPKVTQKVECGLPGYEDVFVRVWVNAPQRIFDKWLEMKADAVVHGEDNRPVIDTDPETGEPLVDENFRPLIKIDEDKALRASQFFMNSLITEFSLDEDMEGNPLSFSDPDFLERVPQELIRWLFDAVSGSISERRQVGKESVRLAEIIGQRYEAA